MCLFNKKTACFSKQTVQVIKKPLAGLTENLSKLRFGLRIKGSEILRPA